MALFSQAVKCLSVKPRPETALLVGPSTPIWRPSWFAFDEPLLAVRSHGGMSWSVAGEQLCLATQSVHRGAGAIMALLDLS